MSNEPDFPGMITPVTGRILRDLAAQVPPDQAIVELGSHSGLSTCWMASRARAHVTAIDPWGPPRPGSNDDPLGLGDKPLAKFLENVHRQDLEDRITPLRAKSVDVAPMWVQPVGLLFIDAVHEYQPVLEDLRAWAPHVAPYGWLALDDYTTDPEHPYFGVHQALEEYLVLGSWSAPSVVGPLWVAQRLP